MQNILLVAPAEKEGAHSVPLHDSLEAAGYRVARTTLASGMETMTALCQAFSGRPPDIVVADLTDAYDCLPLRHAIRLLHDAWGDDLPLPLRLALLTPRHLTLPDWPAYADDFLLPPFAPAEVLARLALCQFRLRHLQGVDRLQIADVTLELAGARALNKSGETIPLTPREYELLRFLTIHRGKFFARDRLLDMVWGVDFEGGERTVDIHVRRLRSKLSSDAGKMLQTRRGIGYGLIVS